MRRLPIGAEVATKDSAHFRVWAPRRRRVEVVLEGSPEQSKAVDLATERDGYFAGLIAGVRAGTLYRYRLDGGPELFPDPASRFQPDGPHGPSQVIDPNTFSWTDHEWRGVALAGQVIYELHIGSFTPEGTWRAAARELPILAADGMTVIEVMPVADFPGRFGWGYDGVNLFAPTRLYGHPDDFRHFVNEAHRLKLAVILDAVYNHVGPDGNYLGQFSSDYFTGRYENAWGQAINFDGPNALPVREFFSANAGYWIEEFHLDGLRLDATHQIFDHSQRHILAEIGCRVRESARGRHTLVIAESETRETKLVRPEEQGGCGLDALWSDDLHHSARVALTGRREFYYADFAGNPQELLSAVKWGLLYQGQRSSARRERRGFPALDLAPERFVNYLDNHDQVSASGHGLRFHQLTSPGRYRAMTALFLLTRGTPLLFQGQEFGASSPFLFFADHNPELAELVRKGRNAFLAQFSSLSSPATQAQLANPAAIETFQRCKLDLGERETHAAVYRMHRDLLRLRRDDSVFRQPRHRGLDGAVLGKQTIVVRLFSQDGADRLLLVNLGADFELNPAAEPLLAPPAGALGWTILWSSEDWRYGGGGTPPLDPDRNWLIQGEAALALRPE